jgi:hypothetical protein
MSTRPATSPLAAEGNAAGVADWAIAGIDRDSIRTNVAMTAMCCMENVLSACQPSLRHHGNQAVRGEETSRHGQAPHDETAFVSHQPQPVRVCRLARGHHDPVIPRSRT